MVIKKSLGFNDHVCRFLVQAIHGSVVRPHSQGTQPNVLAVPG